MLWVSIHYLFIMCHHPDSKSDASILLFALYKLALVIASRSKRSAVRRKVLPARLSELRKGTPNAQGQLRQRCQVDNVHEEGEKEVKGDAGTTTPVPVTMETAERVKAASRRVEVRPQRFSNRTAIRMAFSSLTLSPTLGRATCPSRRLLARL